jgi:hypothetical protein
LEEPRVTIQVAGGPQSPTWCYLTFQVSFILHRWRWTVSSISQKRKKVLFKLKIVIKVNFKIQVTKQTTEKYIDRQTSMCNKVKADYNLRAA